jgi:hypothetical protein
MELQILFNLIEGIFGLRSRNSLILPYIISPLQTTTISSICKERWIDLQLEWLQERVYI